MTILSNLKLSYALYKRRKALRALESTLKPRPDLRDRRFAAWSMDRRQRYLDACFGEPQSLKGKA